MAGLCTASQCGRYGSNGGESWRTCDFTGTRTCLYDYVTRLTSGRGGTFVKVNGSLVYQPSGEEPQIIAGSRRVSRIILVAAIKNTDAAAKARF